MFVENSVSHIQAHPIELTQRCGDPIMRVVVPRPSIYGIQKMEDFRAGVLNSLSNAFLSLGPDLFERYPIACCAIPLNLNIEVTTLSPNIKYILAIFDGHHRRHVGDKHGITSYPVELYSVQQTASFYRRKPEEILTLLLMWISEAEYLKDPLNQAIPFSF